MAFTRRCRVKATFSRLCRGKATFSRRYAPGVASTDDHGMRPPPPLPRRLTTVAPVLTLGTGGWFVAFWVFLAVNDDDPWLWVCLAGWLIGLAGFLVAWWQRSASRRGARGAQRDL